MSASVNTGSLIEALESSNAAVGRGSGRASSFYTVILFAVISLFLLFSLLFGTMIYKNVSQVQDELDSSRAGLGLIVNTVRSGDSAGAIFPGKGPEGPSLVISEKTSNGIYETRFYLYEGEIMEEYARTEAPVKPDRAVPVVESEVFDFKIDGDLLSITTSQGSSNVALRGGRSAVDGE